MTDRLSPDSAVSLIERLRIIADDEGVAQLLVSQTDIERDCAKAADRIEQLERELEGVRSELKTVRNGFSEQFASNCKLHHDLEEMRLRALKSERELDLAKASWRYEAVKHDKARDALQQAKLQIEYLHEKFRATGSGGAVLLQIDEALK